MAIRRAVCRETNVVCHQRPDLVGLNPRLSIARRAPIGVISGETAPLRSFVVRASHTPASGCRAGIARPCEESLQYRALIAPALPALKEPLGTNGDSPDVDCGLSRRLAPRPHPIAGPEASQLRQNRRRPECRSGAVRPADEASTGISRVRKPLTRPITAGD
jgi:hypothetical protein